MWDTFIAALGPVVLVGAIVGWVKAVRQRRRKVAAGEPGGSGEVALYTLFLVAVAILVLGNLISLFA